MTEKLQDVNFLHLFYFWMVVRNGGISAACQSLHLTQPTVSTQLRKLERSLGHQLFNRGKRELELTEVGKTIYEYADEMFAVGREMLGALRGLPSERALRLMVGIPMIMPKQVTYRLLEPVLNFPTPLQIACHEAPLDTLLADLLRHHYDVILSDTPIQPHGRVRSFNHHLGDCGISICGSPLVAAKHRKRFPESLNGAPFLLPPANTEMRRALDRWFDAQGFVPKVVAEINDSALLMEFGHGGAGLFPVPTAVLREVQQQYNMALVGRLDQLRLRFYAITLERKLTHPALVAIAQAAKGGLFSAANTGLLPEAGLRGVD